MWDKSSVISNQSSNWNDNDYPVTKTFVLTRCQIICHRRVIVIQQTVLYMHIGFAYQLHWRPELYIDIHMITI